MADPAADTPGDVSSSRVASTAAGDANGAGDVLIADDDLTAVAPELLAGSLTEYFQAWGRRIRNGESGALPVLVGLVVIVIFFQVEQSQFLSATNLVNLFVEAAAYIMFGAAEVWVLILSEIDLSVGYVAGVAAFVIAELIAPPVGLPWWLGIIGGLVVCAAIGGLQGTLITRLGLPSFIVTLGGLLGFEGVMLEIANIDKTAVGGVMSISSTSPVYNLVNAQMSPAFGWILLAIAIAAFGVFTVTGAARRRARGLTAPPVSVSILTVVAAAIAGVVLVFVCNLNRANLGTLEGVPWVVPVVLVIILGYSWFLGRTRAGRYIFAIGANPEAARRAGINVARIRTLGFIMASVTAGLAGLMYESRQGSISTDIDGGNLVLFGVAAAVIGGTSLFGGRGKPLHALLGGVVIAAVFNGLALMGIQPAGQDIATAIVLIAAVTLDSLIRRRSSVR
jgi:D-xylose transport system permease protein